MNRSTRTCIAALFEGRANHWANLKTLPKVIGGRYGLSSKEFTPAMVKAVFDNLKKRAPKNHFTVGINDDVSHTSLGVDPDFSTEPDNVIRAMFYGLGADGTVGANKNSIKIIGEETPNFAQGYFVYDSKKSGSMTVSHLRFGPQPIRSTYLITRANFVGLSPARFSSNAMTWSKTSSPAARSCSIHRFGKDEIWAQLPTPVQKQLIAKQIRFYVIDATKVARDSGMGGRINTIMQVCFFALSGVLPKDEAIEAIKESIRKTYGKKGEEVVQMNLKAVDNTLAHLYEVGLNNQLNGTGDFLPAVTSNAPVYVQKVLGTLAAGLGDDLPVSAFPNDGSFPTATAQYEKRNLALEIPVWDETLCIQCMKCVAICPHATIRAKVYDPNDLVGAPATFKSTDARAPEWKGMKWTLQVAAEDCTGCALCVDVCPARNKTETKLKAINLRPQAPLRLRERDNWDFFLRLPETDRRKIKLGTLRQQQVMRPPCSSFPAPAPAAAKRLISRWSPNCSATAWSWPTPPVAPPFTAAICPPPLMPSMTRAGDPPGAIPCSRITPSSALASAFPSTNKKSSPANSSRSLPPPSARTSSRPFSTPTKPPKPAFTTSANASPPSKISSPKPIPRRPSSC